MEDDQPRDESPYSISPWSPLGNTLSHNPRRPKASQTIWTHVQPVTDPSVPAVIKMLDVALRSYFLSPANEPQLTTHDDVHKAIRDFKVSKAPGPNGIPSRAMKHLPTQEVSFLAHIFKSVLCSHHFPKRGGMLDGSLPLNREVIQHYLLPNSPLGFWTRLVKYSKTSY